MKKFYIFTSTINLTQYGNNTIKVEANGLEKEVVIKVADDGTVKLLDGVKINKGSFNFNGATIDFEGDKDSNKNYRYGTYRFEYVWEKMIDKVFGIENKADYFPKTSWYVKGIRYDNASLEPDTIMLCGNNVYILDAKYYKYGVTGKAWDLPESDLFNCLEEETCLRWTVILYFWVYITL